MHPGVKQGTDFHDWAWVRVVSLDAAPLTLQMLLRRTYFPRVVLRECDDDLMPPPEDPEDSVAPAAQRVRAGTLLLANTDLLEPTFRRSVIYIVEHNDGGTLGVVLNRSSETAVYNVLPQWAKLTAKPKTMFIGGPVKRDAALCLATLRVGSDPEGVPGLRHVSGRIVMVDLDAEPDLISPLVEGVRIFAGIRAGPSVSSKARSSGTTGLCCRRCLLTS